jgi:hypothetical protein
MTNKLVVIINSLKVPKIKKLFLYEMKFLTKLQLPAEHLTRELPPPDPRSLCPLSSTEFFEPSPSPRTKFLGTPLMLNLLNVICVQDFHVHGMHTHALQRKGNYYFLCGIHLLEIHHIKTLT